MGCSEQGLVTRLGLKIFEGWVQLNFSYKRKQEKDREENSTFQAEDAFHAEYTDIKHEKEGRVASGPDLGGTRVEGNPEDILGSFNKNDMLQYPAVWRMDKVSTCRAGL